MFRSLVYLREIVRSLNHFGSFLGHISPPRAPWLHVMLLASIEFRADSFRSLFSDLSTVTFCVSGQTLKIFDGGKMKPINNVRAVMYELSLNISKRSGRG